MRQEASVRRTAVLVLLVLVLTGADLFAQGVAGAVTGVVTDPTQAVVPGAAVTVRNVGTGVVSKTQTNSAGVYNVPSLILGTYEVTVESPGFKTFVRQNIVVETALVVRVDVALEVGGVGEKVTVTAEAPLLQAERADPGTEVTRTMLNMLPFQVGNALRDPTAFLRLTPGASGGQYGANIAGGRQFMNEVLVDGVPVTYNAEQNVPDTARPSYDTVAEFRVETATPPAEFGRTSGGVVLLATRSGTNDVHGNAMTLIRNSALAARVFNARQPDLARQSEFAGSLGGPIFIPKLYDGRNRTFFYMNYTGFRHLRGPNSTATVATPAMKTGDFSAYPAQIFDPLTADATGKRQQFPGNIIPQSRISALARTLQQEAPNPTAPGFASNYLGVARGTENSNTFQVRIDEQLSDKQKFSGSIRYKSNPRTFSNGPLPKVLDGFQDSTDSRGANLSDDYIIRPNIVNRVQLGFVRFADPTVSQDPSIPIKVPGAFANGFPAIRFSGQGISQFTYNDYRTEANDNYNLQESLSWTHNKHNFKFGMRVDHWRHNWLPLGNNWGTYNFNLLTTAQPNVSNTGHSYASFLLGAAASASMDLGTPYQERSNYFGFYAQDDFKITRKLTINYGLRWEFQQPWYEAGGRVSDMNPLLPNPGAGGRLGAIMFGGNGPGRLGVTHFLQTYYNTWGPRLGLAYQLDSNTVLRAGYALMYPPLRGSSLSQTGFNSNVSVSSPDGNYTPALWLDAGWPAAVIKYPPFIDPTVRNGQGASIVNTGQRQHPGRVQQIQVGVQRTFKQILLDASYVGTVGHHLPFDGSEALNQLPASLLSLGDLLRQDITSPAVVAQGYKPPYAGFRGTLAQSLRLFPQYQGVSIRQSPLGNTNYQALLVKAEKRFSNGLQFLAAYTLSKALSDIIRTPIDTYNRRIEKSLGLDGNTGDQPQRLILSYYYEMPWGVGKKFVNAGFLGHALGGFAVSGIHTYASGGLIGIGATNTLPLFNGGNRPNLVPGVPILIGPDRDHFRAQNGMTGEPGDTYLNKAAFTQPAPYTFGTLGPVLPNIRSFGSLSEDISLVKRHRFWGESRTLEFRGDFFNAFNRHNLGGPNTDLTSVNFGKITGRGGARIVQFGFRMDF